MEGSNREFWHGDHVHGMVSVQFDCNLFCVRPLTEKAENMARMTFEERGRAVGMLDAGTSIRQVCSACN